MCAYLIKFFLLSDISVMLTLYFIREVAKLFLRGERCRGARLYGQRFYVCTATFLLNVAGVYVSRLQSCISACSCNYTNFIVVFAIVVENYISCVRTQYQQVGIYRPTE